MVKLQGAVFHELNMIMRAYKTLMHLWRGEVVWVLCKAASTCPGGITKQVVAQVVLAGYWYLEYLLKLHFSGELGCC